MREESILGERSRDISENDCLTHIDSLKLIEYARITNDCSFSGISRALKLICIDLYQHKFEMEGNGLEIDFYWNINLPHFNKHSWPDNALKVSIFIYSNPVGLLSISNSTIELKSFLNVFF